jgi:hypothetical protein
MSMLKTSIRVGPLSVTLTGEQKTRILASLTKAQMELTRSAEQLRAFFNLPRPQASV